MKNCRWRANLNGIFLGLITLPLPPRKGIPAFSFPPISLPENPGIATGSKKFVFLAPMLSGRGETTEQADFFPLPFLRRIKEQFFTFCPF